MRVEELSPLSVTGQHGQGRDTHLVYLPPPAPAPLIPCHLLQAENAGPLDHERGSIDPASHWL